MIKGTVPALTEIGEGCRFYERCPYAEGKCKEKSPELQVISDSRKVRCFNSEKVYMKEGEADE